MKRRCGVVMGALLIAVMFLMANTVYAEGAQRIGFVDLAKIFDQYSKTVEFDKTLEAKGKGKEEERKKMVEEIRKLQDEAAMLSDEAKAKKQPEIDEKIKALREFNRVTQESLIKERNEKIVEVLGDIQNVVTEFSKEKGFDVILNSRMLLYGNETLDVTAEILKRLNK